MIQGNFHRFIGAKAVGSSGDHSDFVVQALDRAAGNLALGPEPVQQQVLMGAQHPRHFLHRLQAAAQGAVGPEVQKGAGPDQGAVSPEMAEGFLEHPGPGGGQLAGQQRVELLPGRPRTRLPRRSSVQRIFLSRCAVACPGSASARSRPGGLGPPPGSNAW